MKNLNLKIKRPENMVPTYKQLFNQDLDEKMRERYRLPYVRCTPVFMDDENDGYGVIKAGYVSAEYKYEIVGLADRLHRSFVEMNEPAKNFAGWLTYDGRVIKQPQGDLGKKTTTTAHEAFTWNMGHMSVVKYRGDPEECAEVGILLANTLSTEGYVFIPFGIGLAHPLHKDTPVELIGTIEVHDE